MSFVKLHNHTKKRDKSIKIHKGVRYRKLRQEPSSYWDFLIALPASLFTLCVICFRCMFVSTIVYDKGVAWCVCMWQNRCVLALTITFYAHTHVYRLILFYFLSDCFLLIFAFPCCCYSRFYCYWCSCYCCSWLCFHGRWLLFA